MLPLKHVVQFPKRILDILSSRKPLDIFFYIDCESGQLISISLRNVEMAHLLDFAGPLSLR